MPHLGEYMSGGFLHEETIRQQKGGLSFIRVLTNAGFIFGIKVDTGAKDIFDSFVIPKPLVSGGNHGMFDCE